MSVLRSWVALFLIGVGIAVCTPIVIVLGVLPYRYRWAVARAWARYALWMMRVVCGLGYTVEGREHLEGHGASIVFCKHQSAWETIAMIAICPAHSWVLKRELMWVPFLGWALAVMRPIAVHRGAGRRAVLQVAEQGAALLASGRWVMIFPEGTRLPPYATRKYGVGGAVLATTTGAPVVPIAHNAGHYWPRKKMLSPGTVRVVIGPPIEARGKSVEQLNTEAQAWVEAQMRQIEP